MPRETAKEDLPLMLHIHAQSSDTPTFQPVRVPRFPLNFPGAHVGRESWRFAGGKGKGEEGRGAQSRLLEGGEEGEGGRRTYWEEKWERTHVWTSRDSYRDAACRGMEVVPLTKARLSRFLPHQPWLHRPWTNCRPSARLHMRMKNHVRAAAENAAPEPDATAPVAPFVYVLFGSGLRSGGNFEDLSCILWLRPIERNCQ